jgi:tetratricopeptide (TPR) repeat protein
MTVSHPDRKELAKLLTGRASLGESRVAVHGLLAGYPTYRVELNEILQPASRRRTRDPGSSSASHHGYDRAFTHSALDLEQRANALSAERERVAERMSLLIALPPTERKAAVRARGCFQSWALCERLIEECHQAIYAEAAGAEEFADLAVTVAEELASGYYGSELVHDLRARAWAAVGEVLRITSDLRSADEAFTMSEAFLELGTGDPLEQAWLQELKACLRRDQWHTADADRLLDDAIATYRRYRDLHLVGRAYIHKGRLHGQVLDLETAIRWLQKGLALIDPGRESGLELAARHSLMLLLHESGRHQEAWFMLRASKGEFLSHGGELLVLRLQWLEGKLQQALGQTSAAEQSLSSARSGFIRQGIGFDAALVSLDLAQLYAGLRRSAEMRELAEEMLVIFKSRDLHREAVAALILFQQSIQMETLSSQLLHDLGAYLRRARNDHRLHFENPC